MDKVINLGLFLQDGRIYKVTDYCENGTKREDVTAEIARILKPMILNKFEEGNYNLETQILEY